MGGGGFSSWKSTVEDPAKFLLFGVEILLDSLLQIFLFVYMHLIGVRERIFFQFRFWFRHESFF